MTLLPLPGSRRFDVVSVAPGPGPQQWAGAPSAVECADGSFALAYRVRRGHGVDELVLATSPDGVHFETVATMPSHTRNAAMTERPALLQLPDGRWRLFICDLPQGKPFWSVLVAEADNLDHFPHARFHPVFPGDDSRTVKDPVIHFDGTRWQAWLCIHPRDIPDHDDRMMTAWSTSEDGLLWTAPEIVLRGRLGEWDERGARFTAVLPDGLASYDGRRNKEENWFERTGLARFTPNGQIEAIGEAVSTARYLNVVPLRAGGFRIYYEQVLEDESHELRTELIRY